MGVKTSQAMFLLKPHISSTKCEDRWMAALLQGRKADATKRSVGFSDSLMGLKITK